MWLGDQIRKQESLCKVKLLKVPLALAPFAACSFQCPCLVEISDFKKTGKFMVFLLSKISISKAHVGVMWNFKLYGNLSPKEVSCWGVDASAQ